MAAYGLSAALVAMNLATFTAFALDKQRLITDREPVPEVLLLSLAALGGWPAAKLAQLVFHLQDYTAQFRSLLNLVALPLVVIAALVVYQTVDLWAVQSRAMTYIGEVTGTGPEHAARRGSSDHQVGKTISVPTKE